MVRTAPGLGNVTVNWAVQGPLVQRTFSQISGMLFFTEVNHTVFSRVVELLVLSLYFFFVFGTNQHDCCTGNCR